MEEEAQGTMKSSSKGVEKHKLAVEVDQDMWRVILPRKSTIADLTQAVQERLRKKHKTGGDVVPMVKEIRERRGKPRGSDGVGGGGGGSSSGIAGSPMTLQLDEDDTISDLADSDAEGRATFVAVLDRGGARAVSSPGTAPVITNVEHGKLAKGSTQENDPAISPTKSSTVSGNGKGKGKAGVPHKICYTVAGMPRPMKEGASSVGGERRGPREGTVVALTNWKLRELKQAIARAEGVPFTADAVDPSTDKVKKEAKIEIKITVAPNVTVSVQLGQSQTVGDLWGKVARAASVAKRAPAAGGGDTEESSDTLAAMTAAAAAAVSDQQGNEGGAPDEGDEDGSGSGGGNRQGVLSSSKSQACLPQGHVLMRQASVTGKENAASSSYPRALESQSGSGSFLLFSEDAVGLNGCNLRNDDELILVGPTAISADVIPNWMVQLLVLGQPVGYVCIPNRRLGEPEGSGAGAGSKEAARAGGNSGGGAEEAVADKTTQQLRTLGDLRAVVCKKLMLTDGGVDRVALWIAPPEEDRVSGAFPSTRGEGDGKGNAESENRPEKPRGERATSDDMSLAHYGLRHLSVVDVRLRPAARGSAGGGSGATGSEAQAEGREKKGEEMKGEQEDVVRIVVKTNQMMALAEGGKDIFVSKSTFSLSLVKLLASRALKLPLASVSRVSCPGEQSTYSYRMKKWLHEYKELIGNGAAMVVHVNMPTEKEYLHGSGGPKSRSASLETESTGPPLVRTTMALWLEEPSEDGVDPIGVSSAPLSATVYPLRSTFESDGAELGEWGLLRRNVHVYVVFYKTRSIASAAEHAEASHSVGLEAEFGSSLCWRSRPVGTSSTLATGSGTEGEGGSPGSEDDADVEEEDDSKNGQACFLSCLYMLLNHLRRVKEEWDEDEERKNTTDWLMRELLSLMNPSFPPVALALHQLRDGERVTEAECACLLQCLWGLVRETVPRDVLDNCVLEHSRTFLMWILSRSASSREYVKKQSARALLIQKSAAASTTTVAAAAATTTTTATTAVPATATESAGLSADGTAVSSSSPGMSKADAKVEKLHFYCSSLMERLEPGHAAHLRVNGEWLEGAYSRGGVLQKRQELVPDAQWAKDGAAEGGPAEPTKFEVVWWEAAKRLLLTSPFSNGLAVLRLTHPTERNSTPSAPAADADGVDNMEDPMSWLSLVDCKSCVRRTGEHPWACVIAPLSLGSASYPCLTRDREGRMCVLTGKSKSPLRNLIIFSPLEGGTTFDEDAHALAQALSKLAKSKGGLSGGEFEEAASSNRVARELIVVCMDSSYSMGGRPGFEDDKDSDAEDKAKELAANTLVFDWSVPSPGSRAASHENSDADGMDVPHCTSDDESDYGAEDESDEEGCRADRCRDRALTHAMKITVKNDLLSHACLPQLREVASMLDRRFGSLLSPKSSYGGRRLYSEMVLEELVLEKYCPGSPESKKVAELAAKVYRRYRKEFMDILLEKGGDADEQEHTDASEWAPRQFICPITQGLMVDPAVAVDGHSYERHAILEWFSTCASSGRPPSSPMTGEEIRSGDLTSNLTLKSRIQEWVLEGSREDDRGAGSAGEDKGGGSASPSREGSNLDIHIKVRYGDKTYDVPVNRASGASGIERIKAFISRRRALGVVASAAGGSAAAGGGGGGGGDGGGGGGGGGGRKGTRGRRGKRRRPAAPTADTSMICPSTIRLIHNGHRLQHTLLGLLEGDVVLALDAEAPQHVSFTVKLEQSNERDMFLLARRGETAFSLKLRLWARRVLRRPSTTALWHSLKPAGDGVEMGTCLSNGRCPPAPKPSSASPGQTEAGEASEQPPGAVSTLEVYSADPYRSNWSSRPSLTRLDAVKQLFHAYINRTQAYDLPVEVGLISFGSEVDVVCEPTPLLEDFRDQVDVLSNSGDTRLWDALQMAYTLIKKWKSTWKAKAKQRRAADHRRKTATATAGRGNGDDDSQASREEEPIVRVLVLSDGKDTKSDGSAHLVCNHLQRAGVLVDSVTVGAERNEALKCLSLATSGYAFHPTSLRQALRLSELETVLSAGQRARRVSSAKGRKNSNPLTKMVSSESQLLGEARMSAAHDTEETATLREDPRSKSICRPLVAALAGIGPTENIAGTDGAGGGGGGGCSGGGGSGGGGESGASSMKARGNASSGGGAVHRERARRVQREMMNMIKNPHPAFEVFPSDNDMCFWKAIVTGPESTPYKGGCWMLNVYFPPSYPSVAPDIRFYTPIRHCNINAHGRVCHSLLDRSWTPNTSVSAILGCVYGLLLYPDHDDPLDSTLTLQMYDSNGEYEAAIIEHVKAHASKPRKVWVTELEAEGMSEEDRLAPCLRALDEAEKALESGRLDEARHEAWVASVLAAGGPAPITVAPSIAQKQHAAHLPALEVARASACMVVAWAALKEPVPKLDEAEGIVAKARRHNGESSDASACLAKVARLRWKGCTPGSRLGIARLREAITRQSSYLHMADIKSGAMEEARKDLVDLQAELERVAPASELRAINADSRNNFVW